MSTNVRRWPYLVVGLVVFLFVGLIYGWPIFSTILGVEFKSWNSAALSLTFTILMSCFCIGNILGGIVARKTSPRITLIIAAALVCLGYISASGVQENSIWILYVAYGILNGLGVGMVYNVILNVSTKWFHDKVGTVSGALMMSFALSTLVLGTSSAYLMEIYGWRPVFFALGIFTAAILILGSLFIALPSKDFILAQIKMKGDEAEVCWTVNEMIKSSSFWLFLFWGILMLVSIYSLMGNAKQCALDIGASTSVATLAVAVISICNGLGRLVLGTAYDKLGRKKTMTLDGLLLLISAICMIIAFKSGSVPVMIIGFMLTGFAYGGVPPTSSAFIVDFYGGRNYALKFGLVNLMILFGSLGSYMAGIIKTNSGTFENVFYILAGLELVALILNLCIKKQKIK